MKVCSSSPSACSGRQAGEASVKAIDSFGIPRSRLNFIRLEIFFFLRELNIALAQIPAVLTSVTAVSAQPFCKSDSRLSSQTLVK